MFLQRSSLTNRCVVEPLYMAGRPLCNTEAEDFLSKFPFMFYLDKNVTWTVVGYKWKTTTLTRREASIAFKLAKWSFHCRYQFDFTSLKLNLDPMSPLCPLTLSISPGRCWTLQRRDVPLLSAAQIQHAYFQVQCLERHLATIPSWFLSSSSYNFFPDAQLLACVSPCRRHSPGRTSLYTQPHDGWLWRCARTHTIVPKPQKSQIIILIWAWEWFKMCVCACVRALNIFTCTHKRTLQMVIRNWLRSNISE